jgi:uncharacterized membrane protein
MIWYDIVKFLHVAAAVAWVGGGAVLVFQGLRAGRAKDHAALVLVVKQTVMLANIWFVPTAGATVLFGAVATTLGGTWGEAWVILGLIGFAVTFVTGHFLLQPTAAAIDVAEKDGRPDAVIANAKRLMALAKFDYLMLFTVVADMVLKPGWSDFWVLGAMACVVAAGFVLFVLPVLRNS